MFENLHFKIIKYECQEPRNQPQPSRKHRNPRIIEKLAGSLLEYAYVVGILHVWDIDGQTGKAETHGNIFQNAKLGHKKLQQINIEIP